MQTDTDADNGLGMWMSCGVKRFGLSKLIHPEDCESTSSIVEHPLAEGESPQWRHMIRSPFVCHDQTTQTDDLDTVFAHKSQALDELEEDIQLARTTLMTLNRDISSAPAATSHPTPSSESHLRVPSDPQLSSMQQQLAGQHRTIQEMSVQLRYLTQLVEQLLITTTSDTEERT